MSGGSSGGSQTTTTELPGYAQPYAKEILQRGADLSNQAMPQYSGQLVAGLTSGQQQAINGINALASQPNAALNSANSAVSGIASGAGQPYNTSNPYIGQNVAASQNPYASAINPQTTAAVQNAQQQITNQFQNATAPQAMAQFRNSGAFGGSAMQQYQGQQNQALGNALSGAATDIYNNAYNTAGQLAGQQAALNTSTGLANQSNNLNYAQQQNALNSQNYQNSMANSLNASSLVPGLTQAGYYGLGQQLAAGGQEQTQNQNDLNAAYQTWYNQAYSPYQQLGILQSALSGAMGAGAQGVSTSTANSGGGSSLTSALGGAASGAAAGTAIMPGWGTVIGGGVGLLGGLFK